MRVRAHRPWTEADDAIIREHYPASGAPGCHRLLPRRTKDAIRTRAAALGVRRIDWDKVRLVYPPSPEADERIRRLYTSPSVRGGAAALARALGRPRWYVSRRALELGLIAPRFKEAAWTAEELDLLHETAHISTVNARLQFLKAGFRRSESAIQQKRKVEGVTLRQAREDAGELSASRVGELLGIDARTPAKWISQGELTARRRRVRRGPAIGGDEWVVTERDLRNFILEHPLRLDLRKVPGASRVWLIDLLAGQARRTMERAA